MGTIHTFFVISIIFSCLSGSVDVHFITKRDASLDDRKDCPPVEGQPQPPTRVDTTARLQALRTEMGTADVDVYIIPSEDAHQSEYPPSYDLRRSYISGLSGSAGIAVVTATKAALWTDGRYHLQADDELDCNWILMKDGVEGVPTMTEWIIEQMMNSTTKNVGASPFLLSSSKWKTYEEAFTQEAITMKSVGANDLIDKIWTSGRPEKPKTPINALPLKFAGRSWQDKINDLRSEMTKKHAGAFIVTSLDETAWLFNIRANDILYNPFVVSYAIVEMNQISLYLIDSSTKLSQTPTDEETTETLYEHLNTNQDGTCTGKTGLCVKVLEYNQSGLLTDIETLAETSQSLKVWVTILCNQAIYETIPETQVIQANSKVALIKSMKNSVERAGMQNSHIRDAVALINFMTKLEKEVKEGKKWTEVSAAADLKTYRFDQEYNRGLSFNSISGVGSNGAIIHYSPSNITDKQITTSEMYLLDSGGQYLDGTTDVTRTFHFGTPTEYEKECYTLVLMGHIDLALTKWPRGLYGRDFDAIARHPLWDVGLVYRHGTGHGIGAYLSVHEGPGRISISHAVNPSDEPLDENMFFSDEPGYYEAGKFGIRLETIVMTEIVDTKYHFDATTMLGFKAITLVPYEPHLINFSMLSQRQIDWLNAYHKRVENEVGPKLSGEPLEWMKTRTQQITTSSPASIILPSILLICITSILSLLK
ncbi:xaa-Pro aminopeptidase 1 [Patella vulgata]|uniref:xaa-Pro aminopeptidase 1 n=1 Tax=Patella vulgata TaxID=6465 RepID=UPI00217F5BD7|nr:xaa-Pro aminopeptidase 1 [Patella vulgata]